MELGTVVNSDTPQKMVLLHPETGEETTAHFMVLSAESQALRDVGRKHADAMLRRPKGIALNTSHLEAEYLDKAAASVVSWEWGDVTFEGEQPEHSIEAVRHLLATHGWLYEQVATFSESRANFINPTSKKTVSK